MDTERFTRLFEELDAFRQSNAEATFLSIGGRGYYENPASDLLQFFLVPNNAHGLNTLFIDALLEATDSPLKGGTYETLTVQREVRTDNDNRIDLLLKGEGWLMLIENKIWHEQINPFVDYEALAQQRMQLGDTAHFLVLSPSGHSSQIGWPGLSYRVLIKVIRRRLNECTYEVKTGKWWHFAQDFIQHLDQELYGKIMTPEEIKFVEGNYEELSKAAQLKQEYREHLLAQLPSLIDKNFAKNGATSKSENWCIRIYHPDWQPAHIAWYDVAEDGNKVALTVYAEGLTEEQLRLSKHSFESTYRMAYWTEDKGYCHCWRTVESFSHGERAESTLLLLSNELVAIYSK